MRKRVKISIAIILILLLSSSAYAHKAVFTNSGENKYKSIELTEKILNMTDENLYNLTLKNENGEEIPYFLKKHYINEDNYNIRTMEFMNYYEDEKDEYFNYELKVNEENKKIEKLRLYIQGDDAKGIEIYGSHDNIGWDLAGETTIYGTQAGDVIEVLLDEGVEEYRYYRIRILDGTGSILVDNLEYYIMEKHKEAEDTSIESIDAEFYVKGKDKTSTITIKNMKNLIIDSIELGVKNEEIFNRSVRMENSGIEDRIYNKNLENTEEDNSDEPSRDTTIETEGYKSNESDIKLTIYDQDDKPLEIESVKVKHYAQKMIFDGQNGSEFTLFFGEESVDPKEYEIILFEEKIVNGEIDELELKEISLGEEDSENTKKQSTVFNAVVVAIGVMLLVIIVRNFKKT